MDKYNLFFYPNACHVCKAFGDGVYLKRCGNCSMIAYCSKEHQKHHWPQHKQLCDAICTVVGDSKKHILSQLDEKNLTVWTQWKMNFMLLVGIKLSRRLQYYEEQMFQFLRACTICYNRNPKDLEDCPDCPCASFCSNHKNATHKDICFNFKRCYDLDVALQNHKPDIPELLFPERKRQPLLPKNIADFVQNYVKKSESWKLSIKEENIYATEYLTRPLTLLYTMEKLQYSLNEKLFCVHIIGADITEMEGIELWETILHWLPNINVMKVILIGPEIYADAFTISLCKECTNENKSIIVEAHTSLYEDYVSTKTFVTPHVIVGYNIGIHECEDITSERETWVNSMRLIAKQYCPFVLTTYTEREASKEQTRLSEILGKVDPLYYTKNPFSSLRPYRDFETGNVYYQNQYLMIFEHL